MTLEWCEKMGRLYFGDKMLDVTSLGACFSIALVTAFLQACITDKAFEMESKQEGKGTSLMKAQP